MCDCLLLCSQEVPGSLQGAASGVLYPLQPDKFWGKLLMELDRNCDQDTKGIQELCLCLAQFLMVASTCLQVPNCWKPAAPEILGEHSKRCWLSFYFLLLHGKARCGPGLMEGARNLLTHPALLSHPCDCVSLGGGVVLPCWGCVLVDGICPTLHPLACFGIYLHLCIRCCTLCV